MAEPQEYKLDGFVFDDKSDYDQAKMEWDTIYNLDRKMNLGDPKVALNLYNQSIDKHLFKTPIGYAFLKRLRETIISCGFAGKEDLNMIPVESADKKNASGHKKSLSGRGMGKRNYKPASEIDIFDTDSTKIKRMYEKEKKKSMFLTVAVVALIGIIIAIFVVTLKSKYSYITYFTDYENNIRENIIDEYENWEKELEAREKALDGNTK